MTYLLNFLYEGLPRDDEFFAYDDKEQDRLCNEIKKIFPLVLLAAHNWRAFFLRVNEGHDKAAVYKLAVKLLDPLGQHFSK